MNNYSVQQKMLGLSQCERLCGSWSAETEKMAYAGGWRGLPGEPMRVSIGTAVNMVVLSTGKNHGIELNTMGCWLPGLRNEALLNLALDIGNWSFEGSSAAEKDFWPLLYGVPDTVRRRISPLLGCCTVTTTRQLRFYSQRDVEYLSGLQVEQGAHSGRLPLFTIDAHDVSRRVMETGGAPFFVAKAERSGTEFSY